MSMLSVSSAALRRLARFALACGLAAVLAPAQAQLLEDLTVTQQGADGVARLSFGNAVRFVQQSPTTPADLYRVNFELVAPDEAVLNQIVGEARAFAGSGGVPEFKISYAVGTGRRGTARQLTLQLARKVAVRVKQGPNARSIDFVFVGPRLAEAAAPKPTAPVSDKRYAVLLQRVPAGEGDKLLPIPLRFQNLESISTTTTIGGVEMLEVSVGYFATEAEAESVRQAALQRFPQAAIVDLAQRKQETLQAAAAATPAAPAAPPASAPAAAAPAAAAAPEPPPVLASEEIEKRAAALMTSGREALTGQKYEAAVNAFNQLLLLPPNSQSRDAQELIGLAWERAGSPARAKTEYELYLRLFPQGEGAQRVAQRLASLDFGAAAATPALRQAGAPASAASEPSRYNGSISQYYFGGKARTQSLVNLSSGIEQATLSRTTESAIVTSVDLGARFVSPDSETRAVLRGTGSTNLQTTSRNPSLVNAFYVDHKRTASGLAIRVGRQTAISGGLLGLFDGVSLAYPVGQGFKIDVMGGKPANNLVSAPGQRLFAAVLEADGLFDRFGGNIYLIDQTVEGNTNRRAVGAEVRYSDEKVSIYSLVDYDTVFKGLNAVSLQGSFLAPAQTSITLLVDGRKAPTLQLTNALISSGQPSIDALLLTMPLDQAIALARATSATAKQALLSVSRPMSERWQLGMDLRYSEIGALPAVGIFEATPATGAQYGLSALLTGSNLYSTRDINTFSVSYLTTPMFKGAQLSYSNLTGLRGEVFTLEPSLRFYTQNSTDGVKTQRITPGLRLSYKYSSRTSLLGETIVERSKTDGPLNHDSSTSVFFYVGYRYELF
ncbi:MAG: tetratricopeptide repeat protein [Piscinibacter sp.]|uniref:tetratricopeptide repeat protein n=1 Tax=Piscinibacter sp. TaxID=1903157 RepID=UPI0035B0FE09